MIQTYHQDSLQSLLQEMFPFINISFSLVFQSIPKRACLWSNCLGHFFSPALTVTHPITHKDSILLTAKIKNKFDSKLKDANSENLIKSNATPVMHKDRTNKYGSLNRRSLFIEWAG